MTNIIDNNIDKRFFLDSGDTLSFSKPSSQCHGSAIDRRQFLNYTGSLAAAVLFSNLFSCVSSQLKPLKNENILKGVLIIDAHAHPEKMCRGPESPSIKDMQYIGMEASSFAAVGDLSCIKRQKFSEYKRTFGQFYRNPQKLVKHGKIEPVLFAEDIPNSLGPSDPPGAIFAIEGGDCLEGKPENVDAFYYHGVRMITVVHRRNNEIGDSMNPMTREYWNGGLTTAGRKIIERMQELGMMVDVAHAHKKTLKQIAEISAAPLIDSHTNPGSGHRQRSWEEMEQVAKTGGIICTWPQAFPKRSTFQSWAEEIFKMKQRLGIEHVALGTDGGGLIDCELIHGYKNIRELPYLATSMQKIGLTTEDISAYMGGNFYRIFKQCVG
ncbi:MAG: hypothetical protein DRI24_00770 [Deltaproteobacteria bacterium]|nr:MAG: hypothetical protein DRI24_00770 [Deltaproteobacteria bacterium]